MKNSGTAKLLGILAVLVLIYLGFEFFDKKGRSKNFKDVLVEIDTAKVDKIVIEKENDALELIKKEDRWQVKIADDKYAAATASSVNRTLNTLTDIRASRIVARQQDKWKEYQVDSAGTRVEIFEGEEKTLDIILGRFGFQSQREYSTYVRLTDENAVYAVDNFMGMSISPDASSYRNSQVAKIDKDSVDSISFHYPDSAFSLMRDSLSWYVENTPADSSATAEYLNQFTRLTSTKFYDQAIPSGDPVFTVSIATANKDVELKAWDAGAAGWVVQSSQNRESYFSDEGLFKKLFKGKAYFTHDK